MSEKDLDMDLVELEDDEGGKVTLRVERYFFYNGDEYVLLTDDLEGNADEKNITRYVMKVQPLPDEGEDMEEFVPVEDELMDRLIRAAQVTFRGGADDEDE